ncbi:MAG TPA: reverse transcriptase domain-containing protein [Chlamydiales bacterium]|nr:reverse transcriptase domain-containing protein [Chlamydiales bacterium]
MKGKCRNCGKKGHWEKDCWAPGGGKEGQAPVNWKPKQKEQAAKSAVPTHPPKTNEEYAFITENINETAYIISSSDWLADSAASTHIAKERALFHDYQTAASEVEGVVSGTMLKVKGHGSIFLNFRVGKKVHKILLNDVKHAPDATNNLLSIGRITAAGYTLSMDGSGIKVKSKTGNTIAEGVRTGYMFKMIVSPHQSILQTFVLRVKARTWDKWHRVLGHMGIGAVKKLKTSEMVTGMEVDETKAPTQCPACIQGKQHIEPFPKQATINETIEIGEVVVSDVWGPATYAGMNRQRYYISFTDLKSRYLIVYFSEHKSMALDFFKIYKAFIKRQLNKEVKRIRTDNGREYVNREFEQYCGENGIIMETTAPYSPAQNGIAERLNRTLVENARAMIFAKNLPKSLWPEAVGYACYIKNRSPVRALENMTPYEALLREKPNIERLEEFGTRCWVMVPDERRTKLEPTAECHVFTGINEYSKSWRYWNTRSNKIQSSRNITFDLTDDHLYSIPDDDDEPPVIHTPLTSQPTQQPIREEERVEDGDSGSEEEEEEEQNVPGPLQRRSERRTAKWDYRTMTRVDAPEKAMVATIVLPPGSYRDAENRPDFQIWKEAMDKELEQHEKRGTWSLVDLPEGREAVGCRWVYATKTDSDGNFASAKARLVAQGMTQIPGIDYFDITSPVARFDSLRIFLAVVNHLNYELEMMDVKGAYLNAKLEEEIYLKQPPGYEDGTNRVLLLLLALYGLKQAGRKWHEKLKGELLSLGYIQSKADECVFIRNIKDDTHLILVYVDDLGLAANTPAGLKQIKAELHALFEMTELGELTKIVGIKVTRDREAGTLMISQEPYIDLILNRFNMTECHPVSTPMMKNIRLEPTKNEPTAKFPYAEAIGSLMYAAIATRPDIAFAVQYLSKFTHHYDETHWAAVKRVFRYLKGTKDQGVIFIREDKPLRLQVYADADFANSKDVKSISGYVCLLGGTPVAWSSKKQGLVVLSTTEAEYIALTHAAKELIWIRRLLRELNISILKPLNLYCDNLSVISLAQDNTYNPRTKHINIAYHFTRQVLRDETATLTHVPSKQNPTDIFTKSLDRSQTIELKKKLAMGLLMGNSR